MLRPQHCSIRNAILIPTLAVALIAPVLGSPSLRPAAAAARRGTPVATKPFDPASFGVRLEPVAMGLSQPLQVVDPGDGSGRLFVVEKTGTIRILRGGLLDQEPFLDIHDQVSDGFEQGLLSMACHPDFATNGVCFVDYTDTAGNSQIVRYHVAADSPDRVDPASAETILSVEQPYPNHNGGLLLFGPDKELYIGFGDGGSGGDPDQNGQTLGTLLGKILRIDVNRTEGGRPYSIPAHNPFVGRPDARPEIWAYGLRNPWRFSFDRATGDLYIGDVGQATYEEIDRQPAGNKGGVNFGWNIMEGPACFQADSCDEAGLARPIASYNHDLGCAVTGGYVYRGTAAPALDGVYLFADSCSGNLWGLGRDAAGTWVTSDPIGTPLSISSFGEDASGELYVTDLGGAVYRVAGAS